MANRFKVYDDFEIVGKLHTIRFAKLKSALVIRKVFTLNLS